MSSMFDGPKLEESWISVRGVATYVIHLDTDIEDDRAIVIIPGNPGVAQYYTEFVKHLHKSTRLPVYCVSHVGHVTPTQNGVPSNTGSLSKLKGWDLHGQVQHKLAYIADHLPTRRRLILVGHSIGSYIILKMLSSNVDNSLSSDSGFHRVIKCCLLFPTIERMAESPSGRKVTPTMKYFHWVIPFFSYPFYYLVPYAMKRFLIERYFGVGRVTPCAIDATLKLASPGAIASYAYMGKTEMALVREPDLETISKHVDKLFFYYGANDHWCPVQYYHEMKATFPTASIHLCNRDIDHAFVLRSSNQMAEIVCDWLCANDVLDR